MKSKKIAIFSLLLAAAYWFAEAALHSTVFHRGSFAHNLFPDTSHEIWMRTFTFSLFIGFGFITQSLNDKRISAETRRSQEQFKRLMDESPEAIGIHQQGKPVYANAAALKLLGANSFEEIAGRDILAFVHPDDREEADERIHRIISKGEHSYCIEEKLQRFNGETFLAEVTAIPVEFDGRQAVMVEARNIEERKHWENELKASMELAAAAKVEAEDARKREHEHAKLLERFFQHTHDGIVLLDSEFNFIRVNQAYAKVCNRNVDEFPGRNHFEMYPSPLIEEFRKVVATGVSFQAYARPFTFPDHPEWGETYWDLSLVPIFDASGEVELLLFTLKDVTDRKRAERSLIRTERILNTIGACNQLLVRAASETELLNGMVQLLVDTGGYCMAWVGYAEQDEQKSVSPQAFTGNGAEFFVRARFSWGDNEHGREPTGKAIRSGERVIEHDIEKAECHPWCEHAATYGFASCIALPLCDDENVYGSLSIYADKSDAFQQEEVQLLEQLANDLSYGINSLRASAARSHAEKKLEETEKRFQLILDNAADAVLIVDSEQRLIYANEQAQRLLGYDEEALLEMSIREITPPGEAEEMLSKFGQVEAFGHLRSEVDLLHKDGGVFPAELNAVQLPDGNFFGSFRDITSRKRSERQLTEYVSMLEDTMQGTLQAVSNMVEQRDPYTAGHERRVGTIAEDIARELGWPESRCKELQLIGLVHDIGKIGIPAEILSKPGRLSAMEYALVQTHVERGYEILKDVKFPLPIAEIIHQHHERMDGSGYPQGLKGENILLEARILAVADVLESMASHRPYRPALGIELALQEITGNREVKFDADVVDALLRLVHEKGYQLPE